jgi:membrane protease YdiL (CAAX protease family)
LLLAAITGLVGLGVDVFRPVLRGRPAAAAGFGSHRVILSTTLLAVLLAALLGSTLPIAVLGLTGQRSLQTVPGFLTAAVSVSGVLLGVAYFRFIRPGVLPPGWFGFGRNRFAPKFLNQVWLAHLVTGLFGWLLILLLSAAIQVVLRSAGVEQTQLRAYQWVRELPLSQFVLVVLAGAVLAPFAEEVYFRGIVFRSYLETHGPAVAYFASALVFAMLHLDLAALPPILVLGLVLAWLFRLTASLTPSVIAHGLNNTVAFLVLYFGPEGLPGV